MQRDKKFLALALIIFSAIGMPTVAALASPLNSNAEIVQTFGDSSPDETRNSGLEMSSFSTQSLDSSFERNKLSEIPVLKGKKNGRETKETIITSDKVLSSYGTEFELISESSSPNNQFVHYRYQAPDKKNSYIAVEAQNYSLNIYSEKETGMKTVKGKEVPETKKENLEIVKIAETEDLVHEWREGTNPELEDIKQKLSVNPFTVDFRVIPQKAEVYKVKNNPEADVNVEIKANSSVKFLAMDPAGAIAEYDSGYEAPYCQNYLSPCVAGSSDLISRDNIGGTQEPNSPNTIDGATDGTTGDYSTDESTENITVESLDNPSFGGGDTVQVTAWAHCWTGGTGSDVNFVYTGDASNPSWTNVGFNDCDANGFQKYTTTFDTNDVGGDHGFRVITGYSTGTVTEGTGSYDDNDDLVIKFDNSPPEVNLEEPNNQSVFNSGELLNFSINDTEGNLNVTYYSKDGGANQTFSSPYDIDTSGWSGGTHTIDVWANDTAGNVNKKHFSFTVDDTAPDVNILSPENITYVERDIDFNYTAIDPHFDTAFYSLDSESNKTLSGNTSIRVSSGNHHLILYANDSAGNLNSTNVYFTLDTIITIHNPLNVTETDSTPDLKVTSTSDIDEWRYNVDTDSNTTFTPNTTLSSLNDESHNVTIWADLTSGGWRKAVRYFTVDANSPDWKNLNDDVDGEFVESGETVRISGETRDNGTGVYKAILETNESGTWKNYTSKYGSPEVYNNVSDRWISFSYTWKNFVDAIVGYRVWIRDEVGLWSVTETRSFWVERILRTLVVENQNDWENGTFNGTSADRADNSGNLGLGYRNGTSGDSLRGFWRMDKESTGTVFDYSGHGNHGSGVNFEGDERGAQGVFSTNAFDFDGNDDVVSVSPNLPTDEFTYSFWFKKEESGRYQAFLMASDGTGANEFMVWSAYDDTYEIFIDGTDYRGIGSVPTDTWTHLAVTRNSAGDITLYENGQVEGTLSDGSTLNFNGCELFFSADVDSGCTGSLTQPLNGKMDEVQVYNRSLDQSEVEDLYIYGSDGKFDGQWNNTYKLNSREVPEFLMVNSTNINSDTDSWYEISTSKGESKIFQLGSGTVAKNYTLPFNKSGGEITVRTNLSSTNPVESPVEREFELWVVHYPKVFNPKANQPIEEGMNLDITTNITDEDYNIENVYVNLTDAGGNLEVNNGNMNIDKRNGSEYIYNYSFSIPDESNNVGTWTVNVTAEDSVNFTNWNSSTFTVLEGDAPEWRNQVQENDSIAVSQSNELGAEAFDEVNLSKAVLATNETGSWENKSNYGSPQYPGTTGTWNQTNFTWQNPNIKTTTVAWRIYYRDSADHWNTTDVENFYVTGNDDIPPSLTLYSPGNKSYTLNEVDLNVEASEDISNWLYNLDSSGNTSFSPNITLTGLSDDFHNVTVWANDTSDNWNSTTEHFTVDTGHPDWRNLQDNVTGTAKTGPVNVSVELKDTFTGAYKAKIATDTGSGWQNHTTDYGSPEYFGNKSGEWLQADFLWKNEDVDGAVDYRVWVRDKAGNWNVTKTQEFLIDRVIAFKDIDTQGEWLNGTFNMTSSSRQDNSGNLGIGYLNGTTDQPWSPERSLTGFWRFDRSSGSSAVQDYSSKDKDGITQNFEGDERGAQGVFSTNSFEFDGTDDAVEVDGSNTPKDAFTYSFWVYDLPSADTEAWLMHPDGGGANEFLFQDNNGAYELIINGNTIFSTGTVPGSTWTHVALTRDGSGSITLYENGQAVTTASDATTLSFGACDSLFIGADADNGCFDDGNYLSARMDEVQMFDQELSQEEINDLYFHQKNSKFRGHYNTTFDLGNNQKPINISVDYRNQDTTGNITWFNASTTKGEETTFQVNSGSGTQNQDLGFSKVGGKITIKVNMTATDPDKTPIVDGFTLYTDRESPPEVDNPQLESEIEAGMKGNITVNISDSENNLDTALVNLTDSSGNIEVVEGEMKQSPSGGSQYYYEFSTSKDSTDTGSWDAEVWANDTAGLTDQNSSTFSVQTSDPPEWRNQQQSNNSIKPIEQNNLSAQGFDEVDLSHATLATNETGVFENKTENYGSPTYLNTENTWTWSNFTWSNDSVSSSTIAWKIWYNDSAGNYNDTDIKTFNVEGANGELNGTLETPSGTIVAQNKTFTANATVECTNSDCGDITTTIRYNASGDAAGTAISSSSDTPFYTIGSNPKTCGTLNQGQTCQVSWDINATGDQDTWHSLDVEMEGTTAKTNDTEDKDVQIDLILILNTNFSKIDFPQADPGQRVAAPDNSNGGYFTELGENSNDADGGAWIKMTNLTKLSGSDTDNRRIEPENTTWAFESSCSYSGSDRLHTTYSNILSSMSAGDNFTQCFWQEIPYGKYNGIYNGTLTIKVNATN